MGVYIKALWCLFLGVFLLAACQSSTVLPTPMAVAPTVQLSDGEEVASDSGADIPPTWTALPPVAEDTVTPNPTAPAPASSTPLPTVTVPPATDTPAPIPTDTPIPIPTNTVVPTSTPIPPTNTAVPLPPTHTPVPPPPATSAPPEEPTVGANILPNPSFELGHYNANGVSELQVPNSWILIWDGGTNPFVAPPDDYFVRPETRVLPSYQMPEHERPTFIWDGDYTVKIFKGYWAIHVQMVSDVYLEPGTYAFEVNVFPDAVERYDGNQKVWASDPYSAEVRFIVTGAGTDWFPPAFGQKNTFSHIFTVNDAQTIRVGVGLRNRYGLMNNGWFLDDWSLRRIENS